MMTPFGLTPDQQQQMKMAQRAQMRLAQAFQLFTLQIAYGAKPREAIEKIDEAMDVWGDYMDAHTIEMPDGPDAITSMMNTFQAAMAKMQESKRSEASGIYVDAFPDVLQIRCGDETLVVPYADIDSLKTTARRTPVTNDPQHQPTKEAL